MSIKNFSRLIRARLCLPAAVFGAAVVALTSNSNGDITINEVRIDNPGADINEYLELYTDIGSESLAGMTLVVLGDGAGGSGVIERAYDLSTLTADPFALIALDTFEIPGATVDLVIPNGFENSDNLTLFLVTGFTGMVGDDLDVEDDGILETTPWASIIDGLGIVEELNVPGSTEFEYASDLGFPIVGPSADNGGRPAPPGHAYRETDGDGDWLIGEFDVFLFEADDTPGGANAPTDEISLDLESDTISEAGGTTVFTVSVDNNVASDTTIVVSLSNFDGSEFVIPDVVIPAGSNSRSVTITAVDDAWRDFDQTVEIRTKGIGFFSAETTLTVQDDETGDPTGLRVNEVHPNPGDDANFDGTQDSAEDEFVEIVNDSDSPIDISGFELGDGTRVRHEFPAGTILDPGCAIAVFGGGDFTEGQSVDFQGAILQKASTDSVALNNNGDIVSLRDLSGVEVAGHVWGVIPAGNGSLTMSPDLNATNTFDSHFNASGASSSAGTRTDGSAFCVFAQLSLSVSPDTIVEDAGAMASVLTITRNGDLSAPLSVNLSSDDSEISIPMTADFAADESEITVDIDAVNDTAADGDQPVTITVSATGFISGATLITVQDDGDVSNATVVINELDYDQPGGDDGEFVELFDSTNNPEEPTSFDGYVLVFYNGNGGTVYMTESLDGMVANAGGYLAVFISGIQNGSPDAVALYTDATAADFNGTTADSPPAGAVLVDSMVYENGDSVIFAALNFLGDDLTDPGNGDNRSLSRVPDGGAWQVADPTPNSANGMSMGSGYDMWAAGFPGIGARTDDDDCDGIDNVLEYALGKNPLTPDRDGVPLSGIVDGQLRVSVTKGAEASSDPNLTIFVDVSTDLTEWTNADLEVITNNATTLTVGYTGAATRVYLRVRASLSP